MRGDVLKIKEEKELRHFVGICGPLVPWYRVSKLQFTANGTAAFSNRALSYTTCSSGPVTDTGFEGVGQICAGYHGCSALHSPTTQTSLRHDCWVRLIHAEHRAYLDDT